MPRRSIDTEMWSDDRFLDLPPDAKLVFLRLTTGPDMTPTGAIRAPARRVAADTGLTLRRTEAAIEALIGSGLARRYDDGWVWLPSWLKHQVSGPSFIAAARRAGKGMPEALRVAIGRELDRLFGARETRVKADNAPDKGPTRKGPNSRRKLGPTPGPTEGPTGVGPREGSEPGPGLTFGQSVLVRDESSERPAPAPSPGAPAPAVAGGGVVVPLAAADPPPLTPEQRAEADALVAVALRRLDERQAQHDDPERRARVEAFKREAEARRAANEERAVAPGPRVTHGEWPRTASEAVLVGLPIPGRNGGLVGPDEVKRNGA